MSLVFVDIETTGLNPRRDAVTQLAAIAVDYEMSVAEEFEVKVWFNWKAVPKDTLQISRFDAATWQRDAVRPKAAARMFGAFLRRHASVTVQGRRGRYAVARLAAHNAAFDGEFLSRWYRRLGVFLPAHPRTLCTLQRALWLFEEHVELGAPPDFKLLTLCEHFGVELAECDAHDALADVRATVELYAALGQAVTGPVPAPTVATGGWRTLRSVLE